MSFMGKITVITCNTSYIVGFLSYCYHCGTQLGSLCMLRRQLLRPSFPHTASSITVHYYSKCSVPASVTASEPPFIYCSSPIIQSWNGWGFLKPETTTALATKRKRNATPTFISLTTPQSVKHYKKETLYLMKNVKQDLSRKDREVPQVTDNRADIGQLSYILFKLREEVRGKN